MFKDHREAPKRLKPSLCPILYDEEVTMLPRDGGGAVLSWTLENTEPSRLLQFAPSGNSGVEECAELERSPGSSGAAQLHESKVLTALAFSGNCWPHSDAEPPPVLSSLFFHPAPPSPRKKVPSLQNIAAWSLRMGGYSSKTSFVQVTRQRI